MVFVIDNACVSRAFIERGVEIVPHLSGRHVAIWSLIVSKVVNMVTKSGFQKVAPCWIDVL